MPIKIGINGKLWVCWGCHHETRGSCRAHV